MGAAAVFAHYHSKRKRKWLSRTGMKSKPSGRAGEGGGDGEEQIKSIMTKKLHEIEALLKSN